MRLLDSEMDARMRPALERWSRKHLIEVKWCVCIDWLVRLRDVLRVLGRVRQSFHAEEY